MVKPFFTDSEDKILYAHLNDCREASTKKGLPVFSGFMDPVRAEKFTHIFRQQQPGTRRGHTQAASYGSSSTQYAGSMETGVLMWGGYGQAERKMLGFLPGDAAERGIFNQYNSIPDGTALFPIDILQISFNERFNSPPSHRDYLGSILGLGLERVKIGDICINETGALSYVSRDVSGFIEASLERVGRTPVKVMQAEAPAAAAQPGGTETRITVASLRLDAVVAGAFRLSRSKAAALVEGERVFVNWVEVTKPAYTLTDGDVITVRGLGRVQLEAAAGRTKKDRIVLTVIKMGK
jgi:RNA-binding protein YlmH